MIVIDYNLTLIISDWHKMPYKNGIIKRIIVRRSVAEWQMELVKAPNFHPLKMQ